MSQFIGQDVNGQYPVNYTGPRGLTNPNDAFGAGSGYRGGGIDLLQAGGGYAPNQAPAPAGGNVGGGGGFNMGGLFNAGLDYYQRNEEIGGQENIGNLALQTGQQAGRTASEMAKFQPYTVTSNLAKGITDEQGGLDLQLSPEEQARQNQYLGQSQSLFGGLTGDVAGGSQAIYEQMRAAQRPEEERDRMRMQESLFASGRGGLQSGMYGGGNAETFGFEQARQEAMLNAQLAARSQFGREQQNMLQSAQGLQTAGYNPQEQAIGLFGASNAPASYADAARRQQGSLYGQASLGGLEGFMEGQKQANELRQIQMGGMMNAVGGYVNPITGERSSGMFDGAIQSGVDYLSNASWNPFGNNYGGGGGSSGGGGAFTNGTSGGSSGASQAGAYTGEFGTGGRGNVVVDATNYLDDDYNILDDQ